MYVAVSEKFYVGVIPLSPTLSSFFVLQNPSVHTAIILYVLPPADIFVRVGAMFYILV